VNQYNRQVLSVVFALSSLCSTDADAFNSESFCRIGSGQINRHSVPFKDELIIQKTDGTKSKRALEIHPRPEIHAT
jgi:hypothetical protein